MRQPKEKHLLIESGEEENQLELLQLKAFVQNSQKEVDALTAEIEKPGNFFAELLGIDSDEDLAKVKENLQIFTNSINEIIRSGVEERLQLAQMELEARRKEVDDKAKELDRELELNKLGFASNVEGKREELEEAKKQEPRL